jgi:hypothetical protein
MNFSHLKQLHDLGFALHWLKPQSKAPVNSGWTSGPRLSYENFKAQYRKGRNVGVRLGSVSKIGALGFLAAIDVDVKDERYRKQAHGKLKEIFPAIENAPCVFSGRGNGSAHYYVCLKKAEHQGARISASNEVVKVKMPSVAPSGRERKQLSKKELEEGIRLRPAWEISLLSEGRQIVLPPSIHPDSGRAYTWAAGNPPDEWDFIVIAPPSPKSTASICSKVSTEKSCTKFDTVELSSLGLRADQVAKIETGEGVEDRSAELFALSMALLQRKVEPATIISVFTDKRFFLGQTAFDHARTDNRARAAEWFVKYSLDPAKRKVEASRIEYPQVELEFENDGEWKKKLDLQPGPKGSAPTLRPTFNNVKLILQNEGAVDLIKRDLFSLDDIWNATPWGFEAGKKRSGNTDDALAVKSWLIEKFHLEVSLNTIDEAVSSIARENSFHPVKDFLESLTWDEVPRVEQAFKVYLNAKMPESYLRAVSRKFFLGLIARIYEPGCKQDSFPVLEGGQGIGKSSFGRILVGDQWFIDGLPNFADKDAALYLQGIWLCELAELSTIYRSTKETAKAFIARSSDKFRPPYGHRRVDFPRSCVFLGTTNESDYLTDNTGNRRFWPVKIHGCDFGGLARDREQLLAEAKFLWDFAREPLYLDDKTMKVAQKIQEDRRIQDESDGMYMRFLNWLKENPKKKEFHIEDLFDGPFWGYPKSMANYKNAAMVLRSCGFEKNHTYRGKLWAKMGEE